MGKRETKERLLDTAEKFFAERGLETTSLRDITARAKANLAAVHYHFGSKMGLIQAVIQRRLDPLNAERLRLLDQYESESTPVSIEKTLHAFIAPMMRLCKERPSFVRLAGRVHSDPKRDLQTFFLKQFEEIIQRFSRALTAAIPDIPMQDLLWRMHFLIGAIIHTWTNHVYLEDISNGACSVSDEAELIERLVAHGAATLRAPFTSGVKS